MRHAAAPSPHVELHGREVEHRTVRHPSVPQDPPSPALRDEEAERRKAREEREGSHGHLPQKDRVVVVARVGRVSAEARAADADESPNDIGRVAALPRDSARQLSRWPHIMNWHAAALAAQGDPLASTSARSGTISARAALIGSGKRVAGSGAAPRRNHASNPGGSATSPARALGGSTTGAIGSLSTSHLLSSSPVLKYVRPTSSSYAMVASDHTSVARDGAPHTCSGAIWPWKRNCPPLV